MLSRAEKRADAETSTRPESPPSVHSDKKLIMKAQQCFFIYYSKVTELLYTYSSVCVCGE